MKTRFESLVAEYMDDYMDDHLRTQALEIAKKFKAKGFSVDEIAEATGLTVDEIIRL
jgi:predicted transposase YdaD